MEVDVNVFKRTCQPADDPDAPADELFLPGYFLLSGLRFDFTTCTAEVREILPRDGYDALYRVWKTPVDLLAPSSAGGRIMPVGFVALYDDFLTWQPDTDGTLRQILPDGNAPGRSAGRTEKIAAVRKFIHAYRYPPPTGSDHGSAHVQDLYPLPVC